MIFKRRKYIVDKRFQGKFILFFVIISSISSIIATVVFNYIALKRLESIMWSAHISVKTTDEVIGSLFIYINIIAFLVVSFLLILTGIWMVRKTSEPLYKMSKDIIKVANGDLSTSITLRRKNEFKDIAYELNIMVKNIREKFNIISEKYMSISKSIGEFKEKTSSTETLIKDYNSVLKNIESLETEMNGFKLRQKQ